jgi:hypothetical protein
MLQLSFKENLKKKIKINVQSASLIKTGLHSIPGISQYDRKQDCPISEKVQVKVEFHDPRSHLLRQDRLIVQTIKKSIPSPKFV